MAKGFPLSFDIVLVKRRRSIFVEFSFDCIRLRPRICFARGSIVHQLDFPAISFGIRTNRLCKDKLCRIEFFKRKTNNR